MSLLNKRRYPGTPEIRSQFRGYEINMKMFPNFSCQNLTGSHLEFSSEVNPQENRLQKAKSSNFENEMIMEESQDHNMGVEDSYTYQNEESKNDQFEMNHKGFSVASNDSRRVSRSRKAKKSKNTREKMARNREKLKRTHEEYSQMDYQSGIEAIRELTRYRSLKIAKEREDIVDPRSLAPKVLQF